MKDKTIQLIFFGICTAILSVLLFFVFKPYLGVMFLAGVFAISFYPIYEKFLQKWKGRKNLSALLTTLLVVVCIIIPAIFLSAVLLKEAVELYNSLVFGSSEGLVARANGLVAEVQSLLPQVLGSRDINLGSYAGSVLDWVISHFDSIFAAIFDGLFKFILMLLSIYYLLVCGDKIKKALIAWSPLSDVYDEEFLKTLRASIDAVLRGRILVSVAQGLFLGLGFLIFGVGSPVLWGFVGGIASLIPILGTSVVIVPAVALLFLSGSIWQGLGLILWGALAVGMVDNVLSFFFFKGKIKVHPLIVLFSIIGGVEFFGMIGFLVGPVIVSAFSALLRIYPQLLSRSKE